VTPSPEILAFGGIGLVSGLVTGFFGLGGGSVMPPLLVLALGIDQHRAQGISLAALLPPVGLPAVLAYRRVGVRLDWRLVVEMIAGFLFGASGGAWLAHRVPSRELRWLFAAFLVASAVRAFRVAGVEESGHEDGAPAQRPARSALVGVAIGAVAGVMSGLLGVGGGIVALPLLRRWLGLDRLSAQAASVAILLPPIGLPAVVVYAREQGGLPWGPLAVVAVGFAVGTGAGALVTGRVPPRTARLCYASLLVVVALLLGMHA